MILKLNLFLMQDDPENGGFGIGVLRGNATGDVKLTSKPDLLYVIVFNTNVVVEAAGVVPLMGCNGT